MVLVNNVCAQSLRNRFLSLQFIAFNVASSALGLTLMLLTVIYVRSDAIAIVLVALVTALIFLPIRLRSIRDLLTPRFDAEKLAKMAKYGLGVSVTGVSFTIMVFTDRWLIGQFLSIEDVGLYSVALSLASILTMFLSAFGQACSPFLLNIFASDPAKAQKVAAGTLTAITFIFTNLAVGMAAFAEIVARLLIGTKYLSAAFIIGPLALGIAFYATCQITGLGISIAKRPRIMSASAAGWP